MPRISCVQSVYVNAVVFASTLFVGDNVEIIPRTRALAIQRELPVYKGNEGKFEEYGLFTAPLAKTIIYDRVNMQTVNTNPYIRVNQVRIISVSTSSVFQIGSTQMIDAESRIKHFRQLLKR